MGYDSYTPRTTETRLTLPLNGSIFTTRRDVAPEKPTPVIGDTMEAELGSQWSNSRIVAANIVPEGDREIQQIVHARIPSFANQVPDNWVRATRYIGGVAFHGVERYFVILASAFDESTPALASTMPYEAGGPFDPEGGDYVLVDREIVRSGVELEPVFKVERRFYVDVADTSGQLGDNWSYSDASIGGSQYPAVSRTFLRLADDVRADGVGTPAPGAAMPVSADTNAGDRLFAGQGYIQVGRDLGRAPDDLHPVFVTETRQYVRRSVMVSLGIDPANGKALIRKMSLWYAEEVVTGSTKAKTLFPDAGNAYWGVQATAIRRTGRQISENWYEITEESLIGGETGQNSGVIAVDSYDTSVNYFWPPVLTELGFKQWERVDGSYEVYPFVHMEPDGYRGPCLAKIEKTWSQTPQTLTTINPMRPEGVVYGSPPFRLNIPPCLHAKVTAVADYGNNHPVYAQNTGSGEDYPPTTLQDGTGPETLSGYPDGVLTKWPDSIVSQDDQDRFRGGYLRVKVTVFKPGTPTS